MPFLTIQCILISQLRNLQIIHFYFILIEIFFCFRSDQKLSLVGNPGQLLKPSQTETMSCEYLSLDTIERWIICNN